MNARLQSNCEERQASDNYKIKKNLPTVEFEPTANRSRVGFSINCATWDLLGELRVSLKVTFIHSFYILHIDVSSTCALSCIAIEYKHKICIILLNFDQCRCFLTVNTMQYTKNTPLDLLLVELISIYIGRMYK